MKYQKDLQKTRNWVAKHNRNRAARHRAVTDYRRHTKHRNQEMP